MPFTLAHPAAVLPLRRTRLVFSALIIGSMAPDFPYFLTLGDDIRWGHSWLGVFLFCLPAGLAVLWLFHAIVKRPLASLAPEFMRARIAKRDMEFRFAPWPRFLLIVGSLLIGTLTHILWDGFTHEHGLFVKHWAALSTRVSILDHHVPLWKALQFVCSPIGVAIVVAMAAWWWYRKPISADPVPAAITPRMRWFLIAAGVALACCAGAIGGYPALHSNWKIAVIDGVICAIAAGCAELLVFGLAWRVVQMGRNKQKPLDAGVQRLNTVEH